MTNPLQILEDLVGQIGNLKPEMLTACFTIGLGYILRITKWFRNRYIPAVVVFLPMIFYPLLAGGLSISADGYSSSIVRLMLRGFLIGFVAWAIHGLLLRKLEDWLKAKFGTSMESALKAGDSDPPFKNE